MDKTWICESCYGHKSDNGGTNGSALYKFGSQEALIRHITHHHLSKKIERGRTVFICTYVIVVEPFYALEVLLRILIQSCVHLVRMRSILFY